MTSNSVDVSETIETVSSSIDRDLAGFWMDTADVSNYRVVRTKLNDRAAIKNIEIQVREPRLKVAKQDVVALSLLVVSSGTLFWTSIQDLLTSNFYYGAVTMFMAIFAFAFIVQGLRDLAERRQDSWKVLDREMEKSYDPSSKDVYLKLKDLTESENLGESEESLKTLQDVVLRGIIVEDKVFDRLRDIKGNINIVENKAPFDLKAKVLAGLENSEQKLENVLTSFWDAIRDVDAQIIVIEQALAHNKFMHDLAGFMSVDDMTDNELTEALSAAESKIRKSLSELDFLMGVSR